MPTNMSYELKPCPFCGGEPVVCGYPDEFMVYVKCSKCGAMSGLVQATEEKAAENWNRRHERTCRNEATGPEVIFDCSECLASFVNEPIDGGWSYCPNCGAKVVSE